MSAVERISPPDRKLFILLVGAASKERALICHSASDHALHIEPIASVDELRVRDLKAADVFVAWDEGETIPELGRRLAADGSCAPIVAMGTALTGRQVVRAINSGAMDFVEWPCDVASLRLAVRAADNRRAQMLPQKERQAKARSALEKLSQRELQVLAALTDGMANKAIGRALRISPRTVEAHRANIMDKVEAKHSADLVRLSLEASSPLPPSPYQEYSADRLPVGYPLAQLPISMFGPAPD